jgi:hypothetical protein
MILIENEPLTDVQKQWLDKIGFFQTEVIESQPTEWDGKHMEHKQFQWYDLPKEPTLRASLGEDLTTQSDQSDEKTSAPQH